MVILLSRIFRRNDASGFPDKWILIIYQVVTSGSMLNWGEIISSNMDTKLKKVKNEHKFYMASYMMDVICASREYPSLGWKRDPCLPSIHVYCKMIWENKYKEDYERIFNGLFAPIYHILFREEAPCISLEGHVVTQKYGNWYMNPDGVYIRMIGRTKAPHWIPHFILDKLCCKK